MRLVRSARREPLSIVHILILGLALQLAVPSPVMASGGPQFVQQISATTISSSVSATFPSSVGGSNTIIVAVTGFGFPSGILPTSVTDSAGNSYVKAVDYPLVATANASSIGIWYAANVTGGPNLKVTGTFSSTGTLAIAIQEYSGLGVAVSAYQAVAASGNSGTATTCQPMQTNQTAELLVAAMTVDNHVAISTVSNGVGYTLRAQRLLSDFSNQAIVTEDQGTGTGSALPPGYYPTSFVGLTVQGNVTPNWHLVAAGFGASVSPTNTPLPTPTGSPVLGCITQPVSQLFLPVVTNGSSLAGW